MNLKDRSVRAGDVLKLVERQYDSVKGSFYRARGSNAPADEVEGHSETLWQLAILKNDIVDLLIDDMTNAKEG